MTANGNGARIEIDPHAMLRAEQRGTNETQIVETVRFGEKFPARDGRTGFRRNFTFAGMHNGTYYETIQLMVIAQKMPNGWLVITVITKFF